MALIYCGIDEAGYGPMLGPLCVGFSAFCFERWDPEAGAPDLWESLEAAVCRKARDSRSRIAVADSKKLKLSNQSKTRHPLTHLERGVLAFAGLLHCGAGFQPAGGEPESEAESAGKMPAPQSFDTDTSLFDALGVHLEPHDWYAGDPVGLPLAGSRAQHAIARNKLALACEAAGIEPVALACIAVGEREFNEAVRTGGSKAHLTSRCFARYLRRALERWGGGTDDVRVVCDRHGGRTSYTTMIEAAVRGLGFEVETLEESDRCSRYAVSGAGASPVPSIHIQFRPEAEEAHLPVALASMTAKLVRELAMGRFNRYWCGRMPELKPTAGYVQDARRWLGDLEGVLCDDEREAMVRKA
jgi:ribonuclease HII